MASPSDPFANAQQFSIENTALTSAGDLAVTQTTYNVTIIANAIDSTAGQIFDEVKWRELIKQIEDTAQRSKEGNKEKPEGGLSSDDVAPAPQAVVNPKSITRRLVIFTAVDIARKKLKATVNIVFTLTPPGSTPSGQPWPPIVWKKLAFQPGVARRQDIMWHSEVGFSTVKEKAGGILSPDGLNAPVEPKHVAIFEDAETASIFSSQEELPMDTDSIAILNKQPQSQRFALCVVDKTRIDTDQFLPVVDLGSLGCDDILVCDRPIMIQAYIVSSTSEYEERKPLKYEDMKRALLPHHGINVTELKQTTPFRLYSNNAGKILLEKE